MCRADSLPRVLTGIVPDRELTIVSIESDKYAVRVNYRVAPPLPEDRGMGDGDLSWRFVHWQIDLTDDLGTTYWPGGGAAGLDQGVRSLTPPLPSAASELTLRIRPYRAETPTYTMQVSADHILRV
ncbi:hypothetical protein [Sulfobacillus harzensis]|uniref:Uncharacterized protein n=1 Tax=Sulfobacillus harzensis TaxID=2729629 RepID=A0A7Y0Q599_9FIRM|nr:hypothetical protein [Sulfobacillus harzensis]NMP24871.1 hypothetical protein [Sulfobacillus harzensis]